MSGTAKLYDKMFKDRFYGREEPYKQGIVLTWAQINDLKKLIDIGCGRGHYIKYLASNGFSVTGLEPSDYLINNDLSLLQPIHSDILGLQTKRTWDGLYCMDVLEHISKKDIRKNLAKLVPLAPKALFGIANHSDIYLDHELHLIQEDAYWWQDLLDKYYKTVTLTYQPLRFMVFECSVL